MNLSVDVKSRVVFGAYVQQTYTAIREGGNYHVLDFRDSRFSEMLEVRLDSETDCFEAKYRVAVGRAIQENDFNPEDLDVFFIHLDDFQKGVDLPNPKSQTTRLLFKQSNQRVWYEMIYGPGDLDPMKIHELVGRINSDEFLGAAA